jgi:predicted ATPase/two-component SAPR family response regulator
MNAPTKAGLQIYFFGRFEVCRDGVLLSQQDWKRRKNQTLIKVLASERGRLFTHDQLIEILYPDLNPASAARNVHNRVGELRRLLEPGLPHSKDSTYLRRLRSQGYAFTKESACWIDLEVFQEHLRRAQGFEKTKNWTEAKTEYEQAIALYRGDYLSEDIYEEWAIATAQLLRDSYLNALANLAECGAQLGEYANSVKHIQKAVGIAPSREQLYRQKMIYHAQLGERDEALKTYQACVLALKTHFDLSPNHETEKLRKQILTRERFESHYEHSIKPRVARDNLPATLTHFIGRENELDELQKLLKITRLLTLTGFGGAGKTRLALQLAQKVQAEFSEGIWVDLASLSHAELLVQRIAASMEPGETLQEASLEKITNAIDDKKFLIIFDNCEHLIEACACAIEKLLKDCPKLRIVATSREALQVAGEIVWLVPPLALPPVTENSVAPTPEALLKFDAMRLLVERTRLRQTHFALTEKNAAALVTLSRKLEGIPLAIEIASAALQTLSLDELIEHLGDRLEGLSARNRLAPKRHQTLHATIDWSYELLSEPERTLLQRLSIFQGEFSFQAAEAIAREDLSSPDFLATLMSLVDKSLVILIRQENEARYRLLEIVRQYALAKLEISNNLEKLRNGHLIYFFNLAKEAEAGWQGTAQKFWISRLRAEEDNLFAASRWAKERDIVIAMQMAVALCPFWDLRCFWSESRKWLKTLLHAAPTSTHSDELRALVLSWAGFFECRTAYVSEDYARAEELIVDALALARHSQNAQCTLRVLFIASELEWRRGNYQAAYTYSQEACELSHRQRADFFIAYAFNSLGVMLFYLENYAESQDWFCKSLRAYRQIENEQGTAEVLGNLARIERQKKRYFEAIQLYKEALALLETNDANRADIARLYKGLADVECLQGDYQKAFSHAGYSLSVWREVKSHLGLVYGLECVAKILAQQNDPRFAAFIWGACEEWREQQGAPLPAVERSEYEEHIELARSRLDTDIFDYLWQAGRRHSLNEVVSRVLGPADNLSEWPFASLEALETVESSSH